MFGQQGGLVTTQQSMANIRSNGPQSHPNQRFIKTEPNQDFGANQKVQPNPTTLNASSAANQQHLKQEKTESGGVWNQNSSSADKNSNGAAAGSNQSLAGKRKMSDNKMAVKVRIDDVYSLNFVYVIL